MLRSISKSAILSTLGVTVSCLTGALLVSFHAPLRTEVSAGWLDRQEASAQSIYHFAAADCRCSERLLQHLLTRAPRREAREVVVYIGERKPVLELLESIGYEVLLEASPEATGVQAAPWLLVRSASGAISYSGGYEPSPYWESRILFNVEHRVRQASLSTPGCTTSKSLRAENFALRLKELLP